MYKTRYKWLKVKQMEEHRSGTTENNFTAYLLSPIPVLWHHPMKNMLRTKTCRLRQHKGRNKEAQPNHN